MKWEICECPKTVQKFQNINKEIFQIRAMLSNIQNNIDDLREVYKVDTSEMVKVMENAYYAIIDVEHIANRLAIRE